MRVSLSAILVAMALLVSMVPDAPVPIPEVAKAVGQLVPMGSLKPGMTGYCLSPDEKGVDRLSFKILGTQSLGTNRKVIVQLTSGRSLVVGGIPRGMSGSPAYLDDGRLIGALARVNDDPDNTVMITPIDDMLDQAKHVAGSGFSGTAPHVPSYAAFCWIWGDAESCTYATITVVKNGVAFATGHSFGANSPASSAHQLAVFETPVIATIRNTPPMRAEGVLGRLLGTMVWDGEFGSVVELGRMPEQYAVDLFMDDGIKPVSRNLFAARNNLTTPQMVDAITRSFIHDELNGDAPWDAHITVAVHGAPDLTIDDGYDPGLTSLNKFLYAVAAQSPQSLESVRIEIRPSTPEFALAKLDMIKKKNGNLAVSATLKNIRDNSYTSAKEDLAALPLKAPTGLGLYQGRLLQDKVLDSMPAVTAIPVMNRFSQRRALYMACIGCEVVVSGKSDAPVFLPKVKVFSRLFLKHAKITVVPDAMTFTY